jgi:hypothetical protein
LTIYAYPIPDDASQVMEVLPRLIEQRGVKPYPIFARECRHRIESLSKVHNFLFALAQQHNDKLTRRRKRREEERRTEL